MGLFYLTNLSLLSLLTLGYKQVLNCGSKIFSYTKRLTTERTLKLIFYVNHYILFTLLLIVFYLKSSKYIDSI